MYPEQHQDHGWQQPPPDSAAAQPVRPSDDAKRDAVVATNIGISGAATAGSAAAASVIAGQGAAAVVPPSAAAAHASAQAAAAQAAGGGGAVLPAGFGGGMAAGAVGGKAGGVAVAVKVGAGVLGAAVIAGAIVVGISIADGGAEPTIKDPVADAGPLDTGIEGFDIANATLVKNSTGEDLEYQLSDGAYPHPDFPEGGVGYHLVGDPVYADVDGDNDLDAAALLTWAPSAGSATFEVYQWLWEDGRAEQIGYQIEVEYKGQITDLKAVDAGYEMTMSYPVNRLGTEHVTETLTVGLDNGDVVQTAPVFGAVARCAPDTDSAPGASVAEGTVPRVMPREDASPVGQYAQFSSIVTQDPDWDEDGWVIAELTRTDGQIACGWVPLDSTTQ